MTIENLNSRNGQSLRMNEYMLNSFKPKQCGLVNGVYCKSYSTNENINIESSLLQGTISKAIERTPVSYDTKPFYEYSTNLVLAEETKEHKSVKSEQVLLDRIQPDILPSSFTNTIPRNELFGINTRSAIKYT